MSKTIHYSTCPHDCPSACALKLELDEEGILTKVRGDSEQPYTAGTICSKVARYSERIYHKDRLLEPLRRSGKKGSGEFESISWDDALDEIAEQFHHCEKKYGAQSIWPYNYGGTMGQLQRDIIGAFRSTKGYSNQDGTICSRIGTFGWVAGVGAAIGSDAKEIANTDLLVLWGSNVASTQINVLTHFAKARKNNSAKLIVIDPYLNKTAEHADTYLAIKPGTDGALACAVMNVLLSEGLVDRAYLAKHTDFDASVEEHLKCKTPEWAANITGLNKQQITDLARICANTQRVFIRIGVGMSRSRNGAVNVHALSCIPSMLGNWNKPGSGALLMTSGNFNLDKSLISGVDVNHTQARMLDMCQLGAILEGNKVALKNGPPVMAMIMQNTNPAVVNPNLARVHQGLKRKDLFLCVHEQFMTDTARHADIVLPATMFTEHDDIYTSYGHTYLQAGPKQMQAPGQCRSNHDVLSSLANRLGMDHPVFQMNATEILDRTLKDSGRGSFQDLCNNRFEDVIEGREDEALKGGFKWPDKRFRFKPDWKNAGPYHEGMPSLPDHWEVLDSVSEHYPFRLITPTAHGFLNSTFNGNERSRRLAGEPHVKVNPDDAKTFEASDGDIVQLTSKTGTLPIKLRLHESAPKGTVIVEGIWCGRDHIDGVGINILISDEPASPNGGAVFHDTAVMIRKV